MIQLKISTSTQISCKKADLIVIISTIADAWFKLVSKDEWVSEILSNTKIDRSDTALTWRNRSLRSEPSRTELPRKKKNVSHYEHNTTSHVIKRESKTASQQIRSYVRWILVSSEMITYNSGDDLYKNQKCMWIKRWNSLQNCHS